ncbi:MAG TPA: hypothetical protein VFZ49_03475 [Pyrinomonadaceae bacterium]
MKTQSCQVRVRLTVLTVTAFLLFANAFAASTGQKAGIDANFEISVSDVEELYAAVNDAANAGARILLSAGVYSLSPLDPTGQPRPNGGRLELQTDMSLHGVAGERTAVVIEAIGLPPPSLTGGSVPLGAIRVGRGRNALEWLSIRNARAGQGNIVSTLSDGNTFYLRVAHVASSGAGNNLSLGNLGAASSGRTMEVDLVDNHLFDGVGGFRNGFRIRNEGTGSTINVRISGNRIWNGGFCLIVNAGAVDSAINVISSGNHYFDNGAGLVLVGGLSGAVGNRINYSGYGDRFINNDAESVFDRGGLLILGGDRLATGTSGVNDNVVTAKLFGCRMTGNAVVDLLAVGGRSFNPAFISTVFNNSVTLEMKGMPLRDDTIEFFADSVPDDPASKNIVKVTR